jgi:hypothetical protein
MNQSFDPIAIQKVVASPQARLPFEQHGSVEPMGLLPRRLPRGLPRFHRRGSRTGVLLKGPRRQIPSRIVKLPTGQRSFPLNFFLQIDDGLEQLFRARRTPRHIDVYWDEAINSLDYGVGIEHTPGRSTSSHGDAPLWLMHLLPDSLQHGHHFHHHPTRNNHQITLSGAEPEHLGTKPGDVVPARTGGHQFNATTGCGKGHWPQAVFPTPIDKGFQAGDQHVIRKWAYRHENTPFRQSYM